MLIIVKNTYIFLFQSAQLMFKGTVEVIFTVFSFLYIGKGQFTMGSLKSFAFDPRWFDLMSVNPDLSGRVL